MDGFTIEYEIPGDVDALVDAVEVECLEDGTATVHLRGLYGVYDSDHALALASALSLRCAQHAREVAEAADAPLS